MRRATILVAILALALSVHMITGTTTGQGEGPGYKQGDTYTFTYSIEALNFSVRVPKTTNIPLQIRTVVPASASAYNLSYTYNYKEMQDDVPVDRVMNFTVILKPVSNESIVEERVNASNNVLELVFLHNFTSSTFDGNVSGTNHPVLGNYSMKWKPSGVLEMGIFYIVTNITQDDQTRPVLARVLLFEAVPGAIPGPSALLLVPLLVAGTAILVVKLVRGRRFAISDMHG